MKYVTVYWIVQEIIFPKIDLFISNQGIMINNFDQDT